MERVGRYRLLHEVARGATGAVFRAEGPDGAPVAVKLLLAGRSADAMQRRRFLTEVQSLIRLRHPGVVAILDAGEEGGTPWLAMEWVAGETLAERLEREGPLPPLEAAALISSLARALAYCHAQGVLHRDLKPGNVLLPAGRAEPLLLDFGLAKDVTSGSAELSASSALGRSIHGRCMGTPGFWPPEQARGELERVGPRSDVYGLCALLSAMLTGRAPQQGESLVDLMRALEAPPRHPRREVPAVPVWLDDLVVRGLAPDPARRPESAEALAVELEDGRARGAEAPARLRTVLLALALLLVSAGAGGHLLRTQRERRRDGAEAALLAEVEQALAAAPLDPDALAAQAERVRIAWREGSPALSRARELLGGAQRLAALTAAREQDRPGEELEALLEGVGTLAREHPRLGLLVGREAAWVGAARARELARGDWREREAVRAAYRRAMSAADDVEPELQAALRRELGGYLLRRGLPVEASEELAPLLERGDRLGDEALLLRCQSLCMQGWGVEGVASVEALARREGAPALLARAIAGGLLLGLVDRGVVADTTRARQLEPGWFEARLFDAWARGLDGDPGVEAELVALTEVAPDDPRVPMVQMLVRDAAGDTRGSDEAVARAEALVAPTPAVFLGLQRGLSRFLRRDVPGAIREWQRVARLDPDDPLPELFVVATAAFAGDPRAAAALRQMHLQKPALVERFTDNVPVPQLRSGLRAMLGGRAR